jgi:hypothetical protein
VKATKKAAKQAADTNAVQAAPAEETTPVVATKTKPVAKGGAKARPKTTVLSSANSNPFANLGDALTELSLGVPDLDSLADVDSVGQGLEAKKAAAVKVREGIANALKFLLGLFRRLAGCEDRIEKRFIQEELQESEDNARGYLGKVLNLKGALRTIAAGTYLKTVLTMDYSSPDEVAMMLRNLVDNGLIVSKGEGPCVTIGYQVYRLGDFGFDAEDVREITGVIEQFSRVVKTKERERRAQLQKEIAGQSQISLQEALDGKTGKCLVTVPAESFIDRSTKKPVWRGGGEVLFDFADKLIKPIRASGSVERLVGDLADRGGRITRHSLTWEKASGLNGLAQGIQRKLDVSWSDAQDLARDFLTIWHLLNRGIRHAEEVVKQADELAQLTAKAEITAVQFFGLNGTKDGKPIEGKPALLQLQGVVRLEDRNLYNPFFLARRMTEEGKELVEALEIPAYLEGYLETGKKFPIDRWNTPVGDLIQKIKGQTEMTVATAAAIANPAE